MLHGLKLQVFQLLAMRWFLALPNTGLTREHDTYRPYEGLKPPGIDLPQDPIAERVLIREDPMLAAFCLVSPHS